MWREGINRVSRIRMERYDGGKGRGRHIVLLKRRDRRSDTDFPCTGREKLRRKEGHSASRKERGLFNR